MMLAPAPQADVATTESVLSVEGLTVDFVTRNGVVQALDDVSFEVRAGETLAVVGESGSGKSVTAYAVMGVNDPAARVRKGVIRFQGQDLLSLPRREAGRLRGRAVSMIFQNPRTALNPIRTAGQQIADVLMRHEGLSSRAAHKQAVELLREVRIADPVQRAKAYPFEMSGGMCQRVMIALALACRPKLLIADEPTTGIDVTTQAVIMDLVADLARASGMATILITHDLGLAAERADRIVVMHAGHVVEEAPINDLFRTPRHPYTQALIAATPRPESSLDNLLSIPGGLPDLKAKTLPACRYAARCTRRLDTCSSALPRQTVGRDHRVACHNPV
jgi:peptide/nickel transport system ATP-binding protein